uniref:Uncharacterized protein n=1 Tax=Schistocephalus solidus TaxID=70667 RepID=A0A0X3PKM8_SCHSO
MNKGIFDHCLAVALRCCFFGDPLVCTVRPRLARKSADAEGWSGIQAFLLSLRAPANSLIVFEGPSPHVSASMSWVHSGSSTITLRMFSGIFGSQDAGEIRTAGFLLSSPCLSAASST